MAPFQPIKKHKKRSRTFDIIPIEEDEIKASKLPYRERAWMMRYFELKKFKQQHGHSEPSPSKKQYEALASWCRRQRNIKRKQPGKYSPDREQLLTQLDFDWERKEIIITDQQLLDDLKRLYLKLNKIPNNKDILKHGKYGKNTYISHFGSIMIARQKAGITNKIGRSDKLTNSMRVLDDLKRLYEKLGHTPSMGEIEKYGKFGQNTYRRHHKSILTARKKAKIPALDIYQITNQQLLDALRDLTPYLKTMALTPAIRTYGKYSIPAYLQRFGSLKKAFIKAGLQEKVPYNTINLSDKQLLNDLKRLQKELKRTPSSRDIKEYGKYSYATYRNHFGSIGLARKKIGLQGKVIFAATDQQLLDDLKRIYAQLQKNIMATDVKKHGKYSLALYQRHFGGIRNAQKKAGIAIVAPVKRLITDQQLLDALRDLAPYLKTMALRPALHAYGKYGVTTYFRRFGSLKNAFIKAGLKKP